MATISTSAELRALRQRGLPPGESVELNNFRLRLPHLISLARLAPGGTRGKLFGHVMAVNTSVTPAVQGLMTALGAEFRNPSKATPYGLPDQLYARHELFAGLGDSGGYANTQAAQLNRYHRNSVASPTISLARVDHDQRIREALFEHLKNGTAAGDGPPIGVMGGSALKRTDSAYHDSARLGFELRAAGYRVLTGGASGAMDAGLLGASCAIHGPEKGREILEEILEHYQTLPPEQAERPRTTEMDRPPNISDEVWEQLILERVDAWYEPSRWIARRYPTSMLDHGVIGVPVQEYAVQQPTSAHASFMAMCVGANDPREAMLLENLHGVAFGEGAGGTAFEAGAFTFKQYYDTNPGLAVYYATDGFWQAQIPGIPDGGTQILGLSQHGERQLTLRATSPAQVVQLFNDQYSAQERARWRPQRSPMPNESQTCARPMLSAPKVGVSAPNRSARSLTPS